MWVIDKITQLISDGVEESLHLDYKAADALGKSDGKKSEISKDISAFANSDGGVIIYGVKEFNDPLKKHLPESIDPIKRTDFSKEWIEQVINSNISPKIKGMVITPVQYGQIIDDKVLYVVEIPKSSTVHQAKDKRYYKRYNFESVAMEDYEIKDIINRSNKTDIKVRFTPKINIETIKEWVSKEIDFTVETEIWCRNEGNIIARYVQLFISGADDTMNDIITTTKGKKQLFFSNESKRTIEIESVQHLISIENMPILPGVSRNFGTFKFKSSFLIKNRELTISIATDDGSRTEVIIGLEIFNNA